MRTLIVSWVLFAAAACSEPHIPYTSGTMFATCGPADGPQIGVVVARDDHGCGDQPTGDRVQMSLEGSVPSGMWTEETRFSGITVWTAGTRGDAVRWRAELSNDVAGDDRVEIDWSLELADGTKMSGLSSASWCERNEICG